MKILLGFLIAFLLVLESDAEVSSKKWTKVDNNIPYLWFQYECNSAKNPIRKLVDFYANIRNSDRNIYCGGSFIKADAVLTAAYCLFTR